MRCKFPERDLSQRLDQTVCRYKGFPYYVRYHDIGVLALYSLTNRSKIIHRISPDDIDFDVSSLPLGYYQQSDNSVIYCSRKPQRLYKQGITVDGLAYARLPGSINLGIGINIFCQGFVDMVTEKYPPLEVALEHLRRTEGNSEICISRDIALKWNYNLRIIVVHYKNEEAGWIPDGAKKVIVPTKEQGWVISNYLYGFSWEVE